MERKITDTSDENFDAEEALSFDDLNITGNYSDYDILQEEKNPKMMKFGSKLKNRYGEGGYC